MTKIFRAEDLELEFKVDLFQSAVVSVLVYGNEVWQMDDALCRKLKGWCARLLAPIRGREIREEYNDPTFDIVKVLRARRMRWIEAGTRPISGRLRATIVVSGDRGGRLKREEVSLRNSGISSIHAHSGPYTGTRPARRPTNRPHRRHGRASERAHALTHAYE